MAHRPDFARIRTALATSVHFRSLGPADLDALARLGRIAQPQSTSTDTARADGDRRNTARPRITNRLTSIDRTRQFPVLIRDR